MSQHRLEPPRGGTILLAAALLLAPSAAFGGKKAENRNSESRSNETGNRKLTTASDTEADGSDAKKKRNHRKRSKRKDGETNSRMAETLQLSGVVASVMKLDGPAETDNRRKRRNHSKNKSKASKSRLVGDLRLTGVLASGRKVDGSEDADKSGAILRGSVEWDRDLGSDRLSLDGSSAYYAYTDKRRKDRWSNRIAASYGRKVAPNLFFVGRADVANNIATLESNRADQAQLRAMLEYEPNRHRLRLGGGWRWRGYHDVRRTDGDGPVLDIDYRYRLGAGRSFNLRAQFDSIRADVATRDYRRVTLGANYLFPLGEKTDVELGARWRRWSHPNTAIGGHQRDYSLTPEIGVRRDLARGWYANLNGQLILRNSSDSRFDSTIGRIELAIGKRFNLKSN